MEIAVTKIYHIPITSLQVIKEKPFFTVTFVASQILFLNISVMKTDTLLKK